MRRRMMLTVVLILHLTAVALYHINSAELQQTPLGNFYTTLRGAIYILLMAAWGVSVRYRILVKNMRKYLLWIVAMMIVWILLRTAKYCLEDVNWERYLWYLYYIPMLFLPVVSLFASMSIGRDEEELPPVSRVISLISGIFFLLVLTNDFHQLVFRFPEGKIFSDAAYNYGSGYYFLLTWISLCVLSALVLLIRKCRISRNRVTLWIPAVFILFAALYCVLYITSVPFIRVFAGDITITMCCCTVALYESCILNSLIASNAHYEELFAASTLPVFITDDNYEVFASSKPVDHELEQVLEVMTPGTYVIQDDICTFNSKIRGGHVFWQEDVSKIADVISQLEDISDSLKERHEVAREELRTNREKVRLQEANRIYQAMQLQTAGQVDRMLELLDELEETKDRHKEEKIAAELAMRGAYFKRRNNLLFTAESSEIISSRELAYCLHESLAALEILKVKSSLLMSIEGGLVLQDVLQLYDVFQIIVEEIFGALKFMAVFARENDAGYELKVSISAENGREFALPEEITVEEEDGEFILTYQLAKSADSGADGKGKQG